MNNLKYVVIFLLTVIFLTSCYEEIDLELDPFEPELVVEAYINQHFPMLNYVILTRTLDFYNPDLDAAYVPGARVSILEGGSIKNDPVWDESTRIYLQEIELSLEGGELMRLYFDISFQMQPQTGKWYKLEVQTEEETVTAITSIPELVEIDSVSYRFVETENDTDQFRVTLHYQEPLEFGNFYRQMYYINVDLPLAWGRLNSDFIYSDEYFNGEYRNFIYYNNFASGDTVHFFLNSIDKSSYTYWVDFSRAMNNGGPFAAPIIPESNVNGGRGVFTGMAVSYKKLIIE